MQDITVEASEKLARIEQLYPESKLPDHPDREAITSLLVQTRIDFYAKNHLQF